MFEALEGAAWHDSGVLGRAYACSYHYLRIIEERWRCFSALVSCWSRRVWSTVEHTTSIHNDGRDERQHGGYGAKYGHDAGDFTLLSRICVSTGTISINSGV